jgi:hypothetical protein
MAAEQAAPLSSIPFDFWSALIAAVFGLVSGAVASLISPWVHWFIEKRRKSIDHKIYLISELRKVVDSSSTLAQIKTSSYWGIIENHLNQNEQELIRPRSGQLHYTIGGPELTKEESNKKVISLVIARIEKLWKLST